MIIRTIDVICGWCRKSFPTDPKKSDKSDEYSVRVCPHCYRTVSASRKEPTDNLVGRKHFHSDSQRGDVV